MGVISRELRKLLTPRMLEVEDSLAASSCSYWIFALAVVSSLGYYIILSYCCACLPLKDPLAFVPRPASILTTPFWDGLLPKLRIEA
jgi:hypothetical protein